jgi:hypothetical protein
LGFVKSGPGQLPTYVQFHLELFRSHTNRHPVPEIVVQLRHPDASGFSGQKYVTDLKALTSIRNGPPKVKRSTCFCSTQVCKFLLFNVHIGICIKVFKSTTKNLPTSRVFEKVTTNFVTIFLCTLKVKSNHFVTLLLNL